MVIMLVTQRHFKTHLEEIRRARWFKKGTSGFGERGLRKEGFSFPRV